MGNEASLGAAHISKWYRPYGFAPLEVVVWRNMASELPFRTQANLQQLRNLPVSRCWVSCQARLSQLINKVMPTKREFVLVRRRFPNDSSGHQAWISRQQEAACRNGARSRLGYQNRRTCERWLDKTISWTTRWDWHPNIALHIRFGYALGLIPWKTITHKMLVIPISSFFSTISVNQLLHAPIFRT